MSKLKLVAIAYDNLEKLYPFLSSFRDENGFENGFTRDYEPTFENFKIYAKEQIECADGIGLKEGYVAQTTFVLFEDETPVGVYKVRHYLTPRLAEGAGHIGYYIGKEFRGRGLATAGLKLAVEALKNFKDFHDDEIYMSCYISNIASLKTQLACGAYIHHSSDEEHFTRIKVNK